MEMIVTRAGFLTSVQDLGRTGFREFGVSTSGALDPFALRVANLLVGNDEGAAGLEITLGGLQLRLNDERIVAWCGGEFEVQIGSRSLPAGHVARSQAGDELKFRPPQIGCRGWLAISGGVDVPIVLGSRSTDLKKNFGGFDGRALRDGDVIPLGPRPGSPIPATRISSWTAPHDWVSPARPTPILRFVRGMDWTRFNASSRQRRSYLGSSCSRYRAGPAEWPADSAFGRLPNHRRLSQNRPRDYCRSWHCRTTSRWRPRAFFRSVAR